jgi:hypothetical protein
VSAGRKIGDSEALTLSQEPLKLRSASLGPVQLRLRQQFRVVRDGRSSFHISTAAYFYRLDDAAGHELAAWHWHPGQRVSYPHAHVACTLTSAAHLPTGRVSIESVLRLLLGDLGVTARRTDFGTVLDDAERPFIRHRRWHARGPDDE